MADNTAIRSFQVSFPEGDVTELRRRIKMTRWPEHELVSGDASRRIWSTPGAVGPTQGVQLATMQKLIQYWGRTTIGAGARRI
jgi:epoxide hydrolase-like protein